MRNHQNERGLTLVEVLVAAVIVAIMAGAFYTTLSQGIRLWRRAVEEKPELKMDLFFDRIQSDLRNAFSYAPAGFAGTEDALQFFALARGFPVRVRYYYDQDRGIIYRDEIRYEKILYPKSDAGQAPPRPVMEHIKNLSLEYYMRDKEYKFYWKQKWSKDCFPRAVKILMDYGQAEPKSISRIVNVPAAEGCAA